MVTLVILLFLFTKINTVLTLIIVVIIVLRLLCLVFVQDVFQSLENLKGNLLSLSASARRLCDKEQAEKTLTELNTSYEQNMERANVKQSVLENLFSLWQK